MVVNLACVRVCIRREIWTNRLLYHGLCSSLYTTTQNAIIVVNGFVKGFVRLSNASSVNARYDGNAVNVVHHTTPVYTPTTRLLHQLLLSHWCSLLALYSGGR